MTSDPFRVQPPKFFLEHKDSAVRVWINLLHRYLGGNTEDAREIETTQTTQGDTQTSQGSSIDTLTTQMALIATALPTYTISNDTVDRSWDANRAVVGTGIDVTGTGTAPSLAEHNAHVAATQELSDIVSTLIKDLAAKNVLSTL